VLVPHVLNYKDLIAEDLETHSAFFCPIILGSDKTTVSVATGHNEYWPVYLPLGTYTIISGGHIVTALYSLVSWPFQRVSSFLSFKS